MNDIDTALDELERGLVRRKKLGPRQCKGVNKAGEPCGVAPLKPDTVISRTDSSGYHGVRASGDYCITHDPEIPDSMRIQGKQPGAGRPKNPRAVDVLKDRIEADIDEVLDPLWDALEATKPVVVSSGGNTSSAESTIEQVPDYSVRISAARELLDRGYGKAKQSSELTVITQESIDTAIAQLESELKELGDTGT